MQTQPSALDDTAVTVMLLPGVDSAYHSMTGRRLAGGGGIVPDLVLAAHDTATTADRVLDKKLAKVAGKFNEALFEFAVAYRAQHQDLTPGFRVTPSMLDDFYSALIYAGVDVDRLTFNDATSLISRRIAAQLTYIAFGEQEMRRRANLSDHQINVAVNLLTRARDTSQLFQLATTVPERTRG